MNKPSAMNEQNSMDKQRSMDKNTEKPTSAAGPAYRPKVVQQRLDITPPDTAMPAKTETNEWQMDSAKVRISTGGLTLGLGVLSIIGFFVFDAYTTLTASVAEHPIASIALAAMLSGFVACFSYLSFREWRGYKQINKAIDDGQTIASLTGEDSIETVDKVLKRHGSRFTSSSYAAHCFAIYQKQLHNDMSAKERLELYHDTVLNAVQQKAQKVLNKESITAGSLAFISPNNLIQTFAVMWISFRTIRRMAKIYGLRPGTIGDWKLLGVLAQNIAAQGVFDLATDEVANQIGGSLSAKFMENSAEAVAAGALNVRLGKALMKLLK
jgi:putative membrane protein